MFSRVSVLALFLMCVSFVRTEGETSGSLVPKEVFVGDTAVYTYVEGNIPDSFFSSAVSIPSDDIFGQSSSVTIKSINIVPAGGVYSCRITFVPWETGKIFLPRFFIDRAADLKSSPVTVEVSSLSAKYGITSVSEDRPPMLVPGTFYILCAILLLSAAAVSVSAVLVKRFFFTPEQTEKRIPLKKVKKLFIRRFKKLGKEIKILQPLPWYERFSVVVRLLFYEMTGCKKYLAADARDFSNILGIIQGLKIENREMEDSFRLVISGLKKKLYEIEKIRFSGVFEPEDKRLECLLLLRQFADMFFSFSVNISEENGGVNVLV